MELVKLTVEEFTDIMGSDAPAPGGGSAAALAGALGASLTAMVSALTIGKKKYEEQQELASWVMEKSLALKDELIKAVDKDTEAFNVISEAFSMPKSTDDEKTARSAAIQEGLVACVESPLRIMEYSAEALRLAESIVGKSNASAASDLGVSVLELRTAVLGAWLNVRINIGSMKDEAAAEAYRVRAESIAGDAATLADRLYKEIEGSV